MINGGSEGQTMIAPVVLQAEGILTARRALTIGGAAHTLRAEAEATGLPLIKVAREIVTGLPAAAYDEHRA